MSDELTEKVVDAVFEYLDKDILNGYWWCEEYWGNGPEFDPDINAKRDAKVRAELVSVVEKALNQGPE